MTNEELLIPRYMVMAHYPNSPHKIGGIITLNNESFHLTTTSYRDEFGEIVNQQNFFKNSEIKNYPALFSEMSWAACREIEDMPDYVKLKNGTIVRVTDKIKDNKGRIGFQFQYDSPLPFVEWYPFHSVLPSTEEEFKLFINAHDKK